MENTENKPVKKRQINPDRVVLDPETVEFVKKVSAQVESAFGGLINLTHKEIANFLLQSRTDLLSSSELKAIKDKYFDDVRAAQWAVQKLKEAKSEGKELSLSEVLAMIQTSRAKEKRAADRPSKKAKNTEVSGSLEANKHASSATVEASKTQNKAV